MQTSSPTPPDLPLKRWTVEDYHRMIHGGILTADDRVELLDGQIVTMVPQEPPHASHVDEGGDYLKALFAGRAKVRVQLPITLSPGSEPEPDFAIVRIDENRYRDRHPTPTDIYLLIEVSDTTLMRDRHRKASIYARAGIPEYWIINIQQRQAIVLQNPQNDHYQVERIASETDQLTPLFAPDITVDLRHLIL